MWVWLFMFSGRDTRLKFHNDWYSIALVTQRSWVRIPFRAWNFIRPFFSSSVVARYIKSLLLDVYYHGIHILEPSITPT